VPSLTAGFVVGMLQVALAISFAALIFAGSLAPFLSQGIGYALVSSMIVGAIIALFASWPGFVGGNQDVPAAIMALMASTIAGSMPAMATADQTFVTVIVTIAITALLTGLFFLGTGYFRLGGLVRFLPYPVVGGFLAGTGWLLIAGSVS
jgi:SulP family sulfate permease